MMVMEMSENRHIESKYEALGFYDKLIKPKTLYNTIIASVIGLILMILVSFF